VVDPVAAAGVQLRHRHAGEKRVSGEGIHMPRPSYWPLVTAVGVLVVLGSILFSHVHNFYFLTLTGAAILIYGIYRWAFEPAF
jgi:hypothetical protein